MVIWQRRRAWEVAAGGRFTADEWRDLLRRHATRCAYCGAQEARQPDHRLALARGGSNSIDNILPSCRRCNQRKHTSSEREFRVRLANEKLRSSEFEVVDLLARRQNTLSSLTRTPTVVSRLGSSVVEQRTHKPLAEGSTPSPATGGAPS